MSDVMSAIEKGCKDEFTPNPDWLEHIKLLDDQIAFREKTVNDLYERDCKIKELKKENEELKKIQKEKKILIQINGEAFTANNPFYSDEVKDA